MSPETILAIKVAMLFLGAFTAWCLFCWFTAGAAHKSHSIQVSVYNGMPMMIPKDELPLCVGKVAYFREFDSTLVYVGYGDHVDESFINCPIHPDLYARQVFIDHETH